jgi:hypothetical protein
VIEHDSELIVTTQHSATIVKRARMVLDDIIFLHLDSGLKKYHTLKDGRGGIMIMVLGSKSHRFSADVTATFYEIVRGTSKSLIIS